MITYKPFFKTLEKKNLSQYQLMKDFFISSSTLNRLRNNQSINLKTLEMLCKALNCNIDDIVTFI